MFFLSLITQVFGQVTITREIFPEKGDSFKVSTSRMHLDKIPWRLFDTTKNRFDVNLQNLKVDTVGIQILSDPAEVVGGEDVPKAEYAIETQFGFVFIKNEGDTMQVVGVAPTILDIAEFGVSFDKPVAYLGTPLKINDRYKGETYGANSVSIFDIEVDLELKYEVNGHGFITVPGGKRFQAIRVRRDYIFTLTTTIFSGSPIVQRGRLVNWEFYAPGVDYSLLRADTRVIGEDTLMVFEFRNDSLPTHQLPNVQPPFFTWRFDGQALHIERAEASPASFSVYDMNGNVLLRKVIKDKEALTVSMLPAGPYALRLEEKNGAVTSKLFIKY